jgi:hypothetical protein
MKTVVSTFVSKQQLGFVPKRLIGEATHLLKLLQAYLDETDTEGLILALDWEKAFDRVSWSYYHQAIEALGFGPKFASWTKMMANASNPPSRRVKIAGQFSNPFTIKCGVPQGCPFSPLAFLVVAEFLTRMILGASDIEGITADGEEHRISQFADDTQLLLKNYECIRRAAIYIDKYQKATGIKVNLNKYEGIRCGSTRAMDIPQDLLYIKWLSP